MSQAELIEASREILKLKKLLKHTTIQHNSPIRAPSAETCTQTDEPTESGEYVTQQTIAKLSTYKNLAKAFSNAQDKVNRSRRSSKKLFIKILFNRIKASIERTLGATLHRLHNQRDSIRPLVYLGYLQEAWRKVARVSAVTRSTKLRQDAIVNAALVVEFRRRFCHEVIESTKLCFNNKAVSDWLKTMKECGFWRIALFNHQKQRIVTGEFEAGYVSCKDQQLQCEDVALTDLIPAPWYLAKYRVNAMRRRLEGDNASYGPSEEEELAERFPVLIAAVPSYLLEVLGRLRADEGHEVLEKLMIDVLTFYFSAR